MPSPNPVLQSSHDARLCLVLGIDGPSDDVIHCEGSGQYEQCKE